MGKGHKIQKARFIFYRRLLMLQLLLRKICVKSKGRVLTLLLNVMLQGIQKKSKYHELHPCKLHVFSCRPYIH